MIVRQNNAAPLVEFVYQTFGQHFGDLLLTGYGEAFPPEKRSFLFTEHYGAVEIDWVIDVVSDQPPCREEPLVFAALLKLMLSQKPIAEPFHFRMVDLMVELDGSNTQAWEDLVDLVIEKYIGLTFRKYERRGSQRYKRKGVQWGRYKLVSGYVVETDKGPGDETPTRTTSRLDFDTKFIRGLNDGWVTFADLDFGPLNPPTAP
jgi:hypothetical protein